MLIKILQGLFLRGGPHYLCGKREESAIASHGHGKGASCEVIHVENNPHDDGSSEKNGNQEVAWAEGEILRETRPANLRVRFLVKIA